MAQFVSQDLPASVSFELQSMELLIPNSSRGKMMLCGMQDGGRWKVAASMRYGIRKIKKNGGYNKKNHGAPGRARCRGVLFSCDFVFLLHGSLQTPVHSVPNHEQITNRIISAIPFAVMYFPEGVPETIFQLPLAEEERFDLEAISCGNLPPHPHRYSKKHGFSKSDLRFSHAYLRHICGGPGRKNRSMHKSILIPFYS